MRGFWRSTPWIRITFLIIAIGGGMLYGYFVLSGERRDSVVTTPTPTTAPMPEPDPASEAETLSTCLPYESGTACKEIVVGRFVDCKANVVIWYDYSGGDSGGGLAMTALPLAQTNLHREDYCK